MLVVVDDSFSMRAGTRLEDAKRAGAGGAAISDASSDRAQVLALGAQVHLLTQPTQDHALAREAVESIAAGRLARRASATLATVVRSIADSEHVPVELHLFSDLQKSGMPPSFAEMALPGTSLW